MSTILVFVLFLARAYGRSDQSDDIDSLINEVNSAGAKWKAGHNFDPSISVSFIKGLLGVKQHPKSIKLSYANDFEHYQDFPDIEIPETFDAREKWPQCPTIRQIRDQGNCGACWAVVTASAFSDRYCIATNGSFTMPFSVEELLTCCYKCGQGCFGGFPYEAWKYLEYNGLVTGGAYGSSSGCQPYDIQPCEHHMIGSLPNCKDLEKVKTPVCHKTCTNPQYNDSYESDHRKLNRAYRLRSVAEIQKDILLHGPVGAALVVYSDFTTYKSGVYHHVAGGLLGRHALKILGWGVEDGTPYWLLANSWNTHWGDNGFVKFLRGSNHCGIELDVVAGTPLV